MPTCKVEGCDDEAIGTIVGANGYRPAYRCRDCLVYDLGIGGASA